MRIKLIVEDGDRRVEIPVTKAEMDSVYNIRLMIADDEVKNVYKTLKQSGRIKHFYSFHKKLLHMLHDVIDEGKVYEVISWDPYKSKPGIHYTVKKPIWKKRDTYGTRR